jgi:capsular exopolysaccharide synthesis family protein
MHIFEEIAPHPSSPRYATTQLHIIQKKEILHPVIEKLNLVGKWAPLHGVKSREDAHHLLSRKIHVREIRNSNLLLLLVDSEDPQESALLANTIALVYQGKMVEEQQRSVNRSLSALSTEVEKQKERVARAHKTMTALRQELDITDINPDSDPEMLNSKRSSLIAEESRLNHLRTQTETMRSTLSEVEKMSDDDLARSLPGLGIVDQTIASSLPKYLELTAELSKIIKSGLGPLHPTVKSMSAKRDKYAEQVRAQTRTLRNTLQTNLQISEGSLLKMESLVSSSRADFGKSRADSRDYMKAKADYIQAKKIMEAAELRLSSETMQMFMPIFPIRVWESAEPPTVPHFPRVAVILALSSLVALFCSVGSVFFLEYLDTSVKTMDDVEKALELPVLGAIPKDLKFSPLAPFSPDAEAYRMLRVNLEFKLGSLSSRVITVTSASPSEGKSTTVSNLGLIFSQGGYRTLIVDADLRRPTQHRNFDLKNETGLSSYLTKGASFLSTVSHTPFSNLSVLSAGPVSTEASSLLNSQRMLELVQNVSEEFDVVLFDSPPILGLSDASILSRASNTTLVVVRHRHLPVKIMKYIKRAICSAGGHASGVVLNRVDSRCDQNLEYYTDYQSSQLYSFPEADALLGSPIRFAHCG